MSIYLLHDISCRIDNLQIRMKVKFEKCKNIFI